MKGLKSRIITTILDETGIRLHPRDFQIVTADHMLSLKLWSQELIRKKYQSEKSLESDEFAEDLLTELFDEFSNLREKIIEVKKEHLTHTFLEDVRSKVLKNLKASKVEKGVLDGLEFEFVENTPAKNSKINTDWGLPVLGLRISNYVNIDYFHTIDIYKDPLTFDDKQISEELLAKIR